VKSPVAKRSIYLGGRRRTTVTLEDAFWLGLKEIARGRRMTVSDLVVEINAQPRPTNLSSALRLFVLAYYRNRSAHLH
jgi:predicted DNA-binding ribbon-helix-helix protein